MLGPLSSHPVGKVLARLHEVLGDGDVPGIASVFDTNARLDTLDGRSAIAEHFRALLARAEARQVNLGMRRFQRDGAGWSVEAGLEIRVLRDGRIESVLENRYTLKLAERDGALEIMRMERQ